MTPEFTKPIETFKDVLNSDLKWEVSFFGTIGETAMKEHEDPVIKAIWNGMVPKPFSSDPDVRLPLLFLIIQSILD